MENQIVLTNTTPDGEKLEAIFLPDKGMNLISFKKGEIQALDQSTRPLFDERYAGLGALIGPHFHHSNPATTPPIADESLFPHIARVRAKGVQDPFSHGIARYAPWKATATSNSVKATLNGKDTWNGVPLASLEGQNFTMHFDATLTPTHLQLHLDIVSDTDSVVGIHYYCHLPQGTGIVTSRVQPYYIDKGERKAIPEEWTKGGANELYFDLAQESDFTFYPFPAGSGGEIVLDAGTHRIVTTYRAPSQENSWQLYHPKGASFVCMEPLSAQDARHPNLTVSSLDISIAID